jgi:adenylosuccinate lyase
MRSWETGDDFRTVLEADPEVTSRLIPAQLGGIFDLESFLQYIDVAYTRLGL